MNLADEILAANPGDPGHVEGLVGRFSVREQRLDGDPFTAAIGAFSRSMQVASGAVLDRRIMPPEEWIESPYHSGPFAMDFLWPEKKRAFIEAARGGITTVVLTGAIGTGKCLTGDTCIIDGDSGEQMTMREAVGRQVSAPSLQPDGIVAYKQVAKVWESGQKECVRVHLASGQSCGMSLDHPVLTRDGWRPIGELQPGDLIATARRIPAPPTRLQMSCEEAELIGHLVANGAFDSGFTPIYHSGSPELRARVVHLAGQLKEFEGVGRDVFERGCYSTTLRGLFEWTRRYGLSSRSKEKRIPSMLFGLGDEPLAAMLRAIWTDGYVPADGRRAIEIVLASEGLIDDLQILLRRFGVVARKSYKRAKCGDKHYDAWKLAIADAASRVQFLERVGFVVNKEAACLRHLEVARQTSGNPNWDVVPIRVEDVQRIRRETGPWEKKAWARSFGLCSRSLMGTDRFRKLLQHTGYKGELANALKPDVVWERIIEVVPIGVQPVYDLTVPETGNFVANGIIVHNTALLVLLAMYDAYRLSCFASPQAFLGLPVTSKLVSVFISMNQQKAIEKLFDPFKQAVDATPYFQRECRRDRSLESRVRFPDKNFEFRAGVTGEAAIHSEDVRGIYLTECITGDSLVDTVDGQWRIADLVGKRVLVWAVAPDGSWHLKPAVGKKIGTRRVWTVELSSGARLRCTADHEILTTMGFVQAQHLFVEDEVITRTGTAAVSAVSPPWSQELEEEVFDLCVDDLHNYVANGVVVHNCNFLPVIEESRKKRGGEQLDVADDIVTQGFRRMESRFLRQGQLQLCRVVLDSSRQYPDDFVERYERKALAGEAPYPTVVFSFSQWSAKAGARDQDGQLYYSGETFPVEVGVGNRASRILDPSEVPHVIGKVVHCAVEHRAAFEHDIDGSLRDLAGVAVEGLKPLIPQKEMLIECVRTEELGFAAHQCRHPFTAITTTLRDSVDMLLETLVNPATRQPWVNPGKLRAVHADPGVTGDAFGLAMGHVEDVVTVNRLTEGRLDIACMVCMNEVTPGRLVCQRCKGEGYMRHFGSRLVRCHGCQGLKNTICPGCRGTARHGTPIDRPRVYVDLKLKITPPKMGRIQFDDVEALLDRLRTAGFMIAVVTADGHQSEFFLQRQLQKPGVVVAENLSLDKKKDPYYSFRDAIFDVGSDGRRRLSVYDYPPFFEEAKRVEDRRDKIDHPHNGEKDVCDAVAGVVHNCEVHHFLRESVTSGVVDVIRI